MAARRVRTEEGGTRGRPATTPDDREQQIASAAYDLAEKQMRDGTASSQVMTYFLKAASRREELERQKIEHETELLQVKREAFARADRLEELMEGAINAMRTYSGRGPEPDVDDSG